MTNEEREEALAIMNVIIHMIEKQYDNDRVEKAVDTAIAALKAEPCEDAVSRKHLLSEIDALMQSPWFNNGKDDDRFTHYGYVERKEAVEIVRDLCVKEEPPVTLARKKGKWMKTPKKVMGEGFMWYCSECKREVYEDTEVGYPRDKYCSYCGAKMEAENENKQ